MAISVLSAARHLGQRSGWTLSNLQLQKILYLAHMMHLGEKGAPLLTGGFEAWDYGPVNPELYSVAKIFGSSPVRDVFHGATPVKPDSDEAATLNDACDQLSSVPAGRLVAITHDKLGAWYRAYAPGLRGVPITQAEILKEYQRRTSS